MFLNREISVWLAGFLGTTIAVIAAYLWIDRPIALFVHAYLRRPNNGMLEQLGHISDPLVPLAIIGFIFFGLQALSGRPLRKYQATAFLASNTVIIAEGIKDQLKFLFGRTWPETWVENNPSFIHDNAYGFNFMHGGSGYHSFPSGHMAAACAVIAVLWIWYPRFRSIYIIAALVVGAGLVTANYHFLSDVFAGGYVGISSGWMVSAIWGKLSCPIRAQEPKPLIM